jgi:uncharacterized protein (DUF1501 family)
MSRHRACDDFHRTSEAVRRDYLGGRPLTRRQAIGLGIGGGLALYMSKAMPVSRVLEAAAADAAAAPDAPVLVSVFLPGGVDLLDTLVPLHDYGRYAELHPKLKVSGVPLAATPVGVNPSLARGIGGGIKGLFERGKVGFLPGIDYSNPDLSHFHSRHFWETGLITEQVAPGWLGRWVDRAGNRDNPLQGVSMGYGLSPVMRSGRAPVAAVASPGNAGFWIRDVWGEPFDAAMTAYGRMGHGGGGRALGASREAARMAKLVADRLGPYAEHDGVDPLTSSVAYPANSDLGDSLRHLAAMISKPLGIRVADVQAGGDFDTHDDQSELGGLLGEVSECLAAFQADLEARGVSQRTLTFVWSEFGRRPQENDSSGTDHGAGGLAWVQGDRARPGLLSEYPDLHRLDREDNLQVTIDFRRVYSSLLEQHLGTDADAVIPRAGGFGRVALVR